MRFLKRNGSKFLLYIIDMFIYTVIYMSTYMVYNLVTNTDQMHKYFQNYLIFAALLTLSRICFRVYSNVWRYVNCRAYLEMVAADATAGLVGLFATRYIVERAYINAFQSISIVAASCLMSLSARFIYQVMHRHTSKGEVRNEGEKKKIAIIGAGIVGSLLAEELLCYKGSQYRPVFFIDSDVRKTGNRVAGLPVYEDGPVALEKLSLYGVSELIVTIPKLSLEATKQIFEYYGEAGCKIKVYDFPGHSENQSAGKRVIRDFKIEELLFRESIKLFDDDTKDFYHGKTVLVIAHRMRTVEAADKIVVLSDGKVAEEGSPTELLAKENGIFRRMAKTQNANSDWTIQ